MFMSTTTVVMSLTGITSVILVINISVVNIFNTDKKGNTMATAREPRLSSIVVGNIGTVYAGDSVKTARSHFKAYIKQSKEDYGRAAGEDVTWFMDGEIHREYVGSLSLEEQSE